MLEEGKVVSGAKSFWRSWAKVGLRNFWLASEEHFAC